MGVTECRVEVVYATSNRQSSKLVRLPLGATIADAIAASGMLGEFPEIDLGRQPVGVFSRQRELDTPVADGDRVEIYRPLLEDPNRRRQARSR